jgi:hypothetical protein
LRRQCTRTHKKFLRGLDYLGAATRQLERCGYNYPPGAALCQALESYRKNLKKSFIFIWLDNTGYGNRLLFWCFYKSFIRCRSCL